MVGLSGYSGGDETTSDVNAIAGVVAATVVVVAVVVEFVAFVTVSAVISILVSLAVTSIAVHMVPSFFVTSVVNVIMDIFSESKFLLQESLLKGFCISRFSSS